MLMGGSDVGIGQLRDLRDSDDERFTAFCFQTMSAKEKGKFEDLARQDKARYEREMMSYVPARGGKKKKYKDPNAPKRPP